MSESILRIMPFGDSITDGAYGHSDPGEGGYIPPLKQLMDGVGIRTEFAGSVETERNGIRYRHEGHPAWRTDQLAVEAATWVDAARPDIVLALAGMNDLIQGARVDEAVERLVRLLNVIEAHAHGGAILIATLPPVSPYNHYLEGGTGATPKRINDYNEKLTALWPHAVSFDHGWTISEDLSNDGLHPSARGYKKIAGAWFEALAK